MSPPLLTKAVASAGVMTVRAEKEEKGEEVFPGWRQRHGKGDLQMV